MHEHKIGHGDLHLENIVWNYHNSRLSKRSKRYTPIRRDFDFRLAYIDFQTSVQFLTEDDCHQVLCDSLGPPLPFRSPEQIEGEDRNGATFDLFAADVYGLGQILIHEASKADALLPLQYSALLSEMTTKEPSHRPSAAEGLKRVQEMM
ncbi:hypothetical protein M413DRAFT_449254 [Hebeloma cylindrosporum]|uniref:Protein kinase domain-containing protein n=1 Tax=Hebeloma cylindrosporum TaxID=76867 RepID=A0A0C2XEM7_HEBCY|nr:hypothetical protein M413DRAFT_449254 [Hebeloma cylindrosporum h7]